ncbi:MAG: AAA family ATPase [Thermoplasmata archaeon]
MRLDDVNQDHLFCLFKGEPGTRKSTAALSFPTPQYWFSIDKKMDALLLPGRKWGIDFSKVEYDDYSDWIGIRRKLEQLQTNCPYRTIIVDSITSCGDAINRQTMRMKSGTKSANGKEKGVQVGGIPVNTIEDYKAEASAFQELIAILKDIHSFHGVNIILIAHVIGERQDESSSTHFSRIIVTGGKIISAKIPAYCSEIYHFNIERKLDLDKEGDYALLTVHTGADFARTALPLPPKIVFNEHPLYPTYLKPAIEQNKKGD